MLQHERPTSVLGSNREPDTRRVMAVNVSMTAITPYLRSNPYPILRSAPAAIARDSRPDAIASTRNQVCLNMKDMPFVTWAEVTRPLRQPVHRAANESIPRVLVAGTYPVVTNESKVLRL